MIHVSQQFPHLNFQMLEVPRQSNMFSLSDTGAGSNLGNMDSHQSVTERHPKFALKPPYLKDLDNMDPLNISGVDRGKEVQQGKVGV